MVKQSLERDTFIEENLKLVHSVCKRFVGRGIEYDDLYQAGCIGLIKAADGFDVGRGLMFSTYAVPVIMGEVRRLFRDGGSVKVSRGIKELGLKIKRQTQILSNNLNREPTVCEIAKSLGVTAEEVTEALCATKQTISLTNCTDEGISEADLPIVSFEEELTGKMTLDNAISQLGPLEQEIVKCRYYRYMTQQNTAKLLNMSQVQVSRAEKKILQKLKNALE